MKYAYGNGMPGCLFDHAEGPYDTREQAIDAACALLELNADEKQDLLNESVIYFRGERFHEVGAGIVEIFEVDEDWESGND